MLWRITAYKCSWWNVISGKRIKISSSITSPLKLFLTFVWVVSLNKIMYSQMEITLKKNDIINLGPLKYSFFIKIHIFQCIDQYAIIWGISKDTVETLYSTIYYSKYFIELNFDKSTQYVALWTHKRHPIPRPFGRAMECLLWVFQQKLTVL